MSVVAGAVVLLVGIASTAMAQSQSSDATLSGLTLSDVDFGTFASGTTTYTASVANRVTETTVTPTVNYSGARYVTKLDGVEDADGEVSLSVGSNVITVEVSTDDLPVNFHAIRKSGAGEVDYAPVAQATDSVRPTFVNAESNGGEVVITFSEDVFFTPLVKYVQEKYGVPLHRFFRATFDVTIDGHPVLITDGGSLSGSKLKLLLPQHHGREEEVRVSYNNLFARNSGGILMDAAGNLVPLFSQQAVRNTATFSEPDIPDGPILSPRDLTVTEGGTTTYTVKLASPPSGNATINVSPYQVVDAQPRNLTFTPENWNVGQTVTVTAYTDNDSLDAWGIIYHYYVEGVEDVEPFGTFSRVIVEDNETPLVVSGSSSISYAENGTSSPGTYSVTNSGSDSIKWTLFGPDKGDFSISSAGFLTFRSPPDYESPADSNKDNVYNVTIEASNASSTGVLLQVLITVTDVHEPVASNDATLSALTLSNIDFGIFSSGTTSYSAEVINNPTETTVTPVVKHSGASYVIKIGGVEDEDGTVTLEVGSNVITVEVTAEDGVTTRTYTVTVTRKAASTDAHLSALTLSGIDFGTFSSDTTSYTAFVANSVSETIVRPTVSNSGASYVIKLEGASDADGTVPLAVGSNVISVEVTAEDDSTTKTYVIEVTRAAPPSTDASLKALTLSNVNFGTFSPDTTSYTAGVANRVTQTTVTPTVNDSGASYVIKLDGVTDADRTVALAVGSNLISVEVTAEDDSTTKTYIIEVTRAAPPSTDASLKALTLSNVNFGTFDSTTVSYTADVANSVNQTTVTPTVNDPGASYVIKLGSVPDSDGTLAMTVGPNVITIDVTAEDGRTTKTYIVTVTRAEPPSTDANLKALTLSSVDFGTFSQATTSYTAGVANRVTQTTVTPTVNDSGASYVIKLGGVTDTDGTVVLAVGRNVITVEVTAEDRQTTKAYTVTVTREQPAAPEQPSSDASLRSLTLSGVNFGIFDSTTTSYTVHVPNSVTRTTVTPTVNDSGASYVIRLDGVTDTDGTVALAVGSNTIAVEVTAEDGITTKTYTVSVNRSAPLSTDATLSALTLSGANFGGFLSGRTSYTAQVANSVTQTTVTPTANHPGATYEIRQDGVADADGTVALAVGSNVITVEVTAQDRSTTRTYTVTVTRAAPLSSDATLTDLSLSGIDFGTFDPSKRSYSTEVANSVTQTTVTPTVNSTGATYTIKLDGVTDADGVISLAVGDNVITVEVTAQDRNTIRTYTVSVTRAVQEELTLSSDATLSVLSLSGIDFGTFGPETAEYAAEVSNDLSHTSVVATTNHAEALYVVKLDGVEAADGEISLEVGENVITVEVTAEDGATTQVYTVTITRDEPHLLTGELPSDAPPLNFRITGYGEEDVSLAWEIPNNRGITRYLLERYDHDGSEFSLSDWSTSGSVIAGGSANETGTSLNADSMYRYALSLNSDDGTVVIEKTLQVRTLVPGATPLSSDATLSVLTISGLQLDPEFSPSTYHYSSDVENDVSRATVTATPNHSAASYDSRLGGAAEEDAAIELAPGRNVITVHVTAEDGVTTGIYTVVVNRAKTAETLSSDASLRFLSLRGIDIGTFDSKTTAYTVEVENAVTSTMVTPVRSDLNASHVIRLDGAEAADGEISLEVGENVITVEVTAEDGVSAQTYTVTVTRAEAPVPEPVDRCVQSVQSDGVIEDFWDDTCLSEKDAPGGAGDRYARFYAFTLEEATDVTITLESDEDTYLYMLDDHGKDGDTLHSNDDIASGGVDLNSRVSVTLQPGSYTIEATTYHPEKEAGFTLTIEGLGEEEEETPGPEPEPEADSCLASVDADGAIEGSWDSTCLSDRAALSGTGDRYARFYTFSLDEAGDVTIDLESDEDTYLYLLDGHGLNGTVLYEDDDINYPSNTNSRLSERLEAGDYTIEATTYYAQKEGDFTLSIEGLD